MSTKVRFGKFNSDDGAEVTVNGQRIGIIFRGVDKGRVEDYTFDVDPEFNMGRFRYVKWPYYEGTMLGRTKVQTPAAAKNALRHGIAAAYDSAMPEEEAKAIDDKERAEKISKLEMQRDEIERELKELREES